ncbi:4-(cytidine 5'-diphospho)-2-C-methyl-D-erythritol kinase [Thermosyntropha sp.]|uniref:4-(cytidine 5'-diphospho)-2-C-methyl-D-erythritol kinase n=1 Tax=Thermosyntropha sp. TaxID=2740820 RepID=UPI0025FF043F|nr:4-(cytidine 5'-diphospho)-2-C-methyl-D-erythritol kinase [Thermosyntropha sp.]MBO8159786.1 4-(cytidine 5'-diphospho)-2-C-methyl-D-erythritol kinase [Thermosyntropha sp.]
MKDTVIIEAPAKVNLFLNIKGKRSDGYHEIETIMHKISLADKVVISRNDQGIKVRSDNPFIPEGEDNLAYKAAMVFMEETGIKKGVNIYLEKNIPFEAGLGGGSSDAAAVLKGMNELYRCGISDEKLVEWAARIGSDVPFFILPGTALARGRGEIITPFGKENFLNIVVIKPEFSLSTAEVYRSFRLAEVKKIPNLEAFLAAWEDCDIIRIAENMINVLEVPVLKIYPAIDKIKAKLEASGALKALMSGSGSAVFGIFSSKKEAVEAYNSLRGHYPLVELVLSYNRGDR